MKITNYYIIMDIRIVLIFLLACAQAAPWIQQYKVFDGKTFDSQDGSPVYLKKNIGWYVQNAQSSNYITQIIEKSVFGGINVFSTATTISKTIQLPPHHQLKLEIQLWKFIIHIYQRINNWDNQKLQIYLDGFLWQTNWGSGEDASFYNVEIISKHNSPSASIVITSTLQNKNSFWALRNVVLSYQPCPQDCSVCSNDDPRQCAVWAQVFMSWMKPQVAKEGWNLEAGNDRSNNCAGINIYGGSGNIGRGTVLSRQFQNLPPHFKLLVKFQFWKIDSWDNEQFKLSLDNEQVFYQNFRWNEGIQLCGNDNNNDWAEMVVNVQVEAPHRQTGALISMTSTLDEDFDNESWGIRNFFMFVGQCSQFCTACTGPGKSDCTSCAQGFQYENGSCKMTAKWTELAKSFKGEDADGWQTSEGISSPFTKCGDNELFGGYQKFGKDTLITKIFQIPNHSKIRIQAQLWKIGNWEIRGKHYSQNSENK